MLLKAKYNKLLQEKQIEPDKEQARILELLIKLNRHHKRIFKLRHQHGIYIYGDVGRGKSMLMDLFFTASSIKAKKRIHFHEFMRQTHKIIHQWRQGKKKGNPVHHAAEQFAKTS